MAVGNPNLEREPRRKAKPKLLQITAGNPRCSTGGQVRLGHDQGHAQQNAVRVRFRIVGLGLRRAFFVCSRLALSPGVALSFVMLFGQGMVLGVWILPVSVCRKPHPPNPCSLARDRLSERSRVCLRRKLELQIGLR